jgi:hypothetical protein
VNDFFKVNSNGGYFGRFFWTNTGTLELDPRSPDFWGSWTLLNPTVPWGWAGSVGMIRYLALRCLRP